VPERPLAIDLFCGLGGWTEGLLAEGYDVVGFDLERHEYGEHRYPAQLVLQDVLTIHGAQFKDATLIVASPPCQAYSYRAMPWKKAKALPPPDNTLFEACFRIQREACEATGYYIPLVVENVCGAQRWVGRARWHYGSYYLWGDVPALMPIVLKSTKVGGFRFDGRGGSFQTASVQAAFKSRGMNWSDRTRRGQDFTRIAGQQAIKNAGGSWFSVAHNTTSGKGQNPDGRLDGRKNGNDWFGAGDDCLLQRRYGSKSSKRKAASALIAKIPFELARHIAAMWKPRELRRA
jgi:C-5 cytosine-specific DNA methylase